MNKREFNSFLARMKREASYQLQAARRNYERAKRGHNGVSEAETWLRNTRTNDLRKEVGRHG